jgi:uncharacterized membrane protein (DUF4010 family)
MSVALQGMIGWGAFSLLAVLSLMLAAYGFYVRAPGALFRALAMGFLLAALCAYDEREIAVAAGVAATALLYFRPELHGFSERLSTLEMRAIVQFAAVAFVLLPLLPDRTWDPWDAINPFRIGLLVVLISGLSLAGYAALKLFDHRHAVLAMGRSAIRGLDENAIPEVTA